MQSANLIRKMDCTEKNTLLCKCTSFASCKHDYRLHKKNAVYMKRLGRRPHTKEPLEQGKASSCDSKLIQKSKELVLVETRSFSADSFIIRTMERLSFQF